MDYELMMNGNVKIGERAPEFEAETTTGMVNLNDYKGKWLVFFSHPGDFTPVCTTEMIAFTRAHTYFKQINTELLGLSVDSNSSHLAWVYDIYCKTGITVSFPIIADRNAKIARKYGMISSEVSTTEAVRNVYIIDDKGIIRAIFVYPMNVRKIYTRNTKNCSSSANCRLYQKFYSCKLDSISASNTSYSKNI